MKKKQTARHTHAPRQQVPGKPVPSADTPYQTDSPSLPAEAAVEPVVVGVDAPTQAEFDALAADLAAVREINACLVEQLAKTTELLKKAGDPTAGIRHPVKTDDLPSLSDLAPLDPVDDTKGSPIDEWRKSSGLE